MHSNFFTKSEHSVILPCVIVLTFEIVLFSLAGAIIRYANMGMYVMLCAYNLHMDSPKFFRKITYIDTLSELSCHVPLTQIDIPPAVYQ